MVENTQSRLTFAPVTQIMKVQEGILINRMEYVEDRMQFSNTKEKNSNKKDTVFKNTRVEPRHLKHPKIPVYKRPRCTPHQKHRNHS